MDWQICGLPWRVDVDALPEYKQAHQQRRQLEKQLDREAKKVLGKTVQQARKEMWKVVASDDKDVNQALNRLIRRVPALQDLEATFDDAWLKKMQAAHSNDVAVRALAQYRHFVSKHDVWFAARWAEVRWALQDTEAALHRARAKACFVESPLCRPGVQIEVQTPEGKSAVYLLGDINPHAGTCDDCRAFEDAAIVTRYRVVWEGDDAGCGDRRAARSATATAGGHDGNGQRLQRSRRRRPRQG